MNLPEVLVDLPHAFDADWSEDKAAELEAKLGYGFSNPGLLRAATTVKTWCNEQSDCAWPANGCLEYFGDAVLDLCAADHVWRRFPELPEGHLTRLRAELVSEQGLASVAREIELGEYLLRGRGDLTQNGPEHAPILADGLEALFAAIYLDARESGADAGAAADGAFVRLFGARVRALVPEDAFDAKSRLQHWCQARFRRAPVYRRVGERRLPEAPDWRVEVVLALEDGDEVLGAGTAPSVRVAEQEAAKQALGQLDRFKRLGREPGA